MGKINEFSIQLASPQLVYYPGQPVAGNLVVDLNEPMEMRSLRMKLKGKGHCQWSEEEGSGDEQHTVNYGNKEVLMHEKRCLFGNSPDGGRVTLPAGKQVFPFSFNLPTQLPSSYEAKEGCIRYVLKGEIKKPWKFNHKVKLPITVNELIDTNNPIYSAAVGGEKHKEVGCMCCIAGPLDLSASIDRGAYCPGEAVLINASVGNRTTRDMEKMRAKLFKNETWHDSGGHTKIFRIPVAKLDGAPVIPSGADATWANQPLGIPATPPTIKSSKVVTVEYDIEMKVGVPWGIDLFIKMDIVMGTVPYIATYGRSFEFGTPQDKQGPPQANFIDGASYFPPQSSVFGYPDMAPASYSAAIDSKEIRVAGKKDGYTHGQMTYQPVYTFAQPYQGVIPSFNQTQYPTLDQPPPYPGIEPKEPSAPPLTQPPLKE